MLWGGGDVRFFFFEAMRILFPDYYPGRNGEYGLGRREAIGRKTSQETGGTRERDSGSRIGET